MEAQIKASLISLLNAIKAGDAQVVASEMARIEDYTERGRPGLPPQLVHYLENRSYVKALQMLEGDAGARPRIARE